MKNIIYILLVLISTTGYAQKKSKYRLSEKSTLELPRDYAKLKITGSDEVYGIGDNFKLKLSFNGIEFNLDCKMYFDNEILIPTGRYKLQASLNNEYHDVFGNELVINAGIEYNLNMFFIPKKMPNLNGEYPEPMPIEEEFYYPVQYKGNGEYKRTSPIYTKEVSKDSCRVGITINHGFSSSKNDTLELRVNIYGLDKENRLDKRLIVKGSDTLFFNFKKGEKFRFFYYMDKRMNNPNRLNFETDYHTLMGNARYEGQSVVYSVNRKKDETLREIERVNFRRSIEREVEKPVIYFYSDKELDLTVKLHTEAKLKFTYPIYNNAWKGTVKKDGTFKANGKTYPYIFWDGKMDVASKLDNLEEGFVVEKEENVAFFEEKLSKMGLNDKEIADFITYWVPRMLDSDKHFVKFITGEDYNEKIGKLEYSIQPDSEIRIFMIFSKVEEYIQVKPQLLPTFKREGFTVVEWGGSELNLNMNQFEN